MISLNQLLKGTINWRADFIALVEIDRGYRSFADTFGGKFELLQSMSLCEVLFNVGEYKVYLIDILVRTACPEPIQSKLLM